VTRGAAFLRRAARAIPVAIPLVLVMTVLSGVAFADIQATPNVPADSSKCSLSGPSAQCGQWTYWAALGALIIAVVIAGVFVFRYLKDASRFQVDEGRTGPAGRPAPAATRPLAPPPVSTAVPATVGAAAAGQAAAPAAEASAPAASVGAGGAVAVVEQAPSAAPAPAAGGPAATRPPSPRHEPVDPDQETFDRVLAEQLAKGTDRRVAEGRAKAAALKAAREKAGG
jgi:hypothetical protein